MIKRPKIVGLTGGIGSGKTTVANAFLWLAVPVFFADDEAKLCYTEDHLVKAEMLKRFGENIYLGNGELNKPQLAQLIFSNNDDRAFVENLVHPAVRRRFEAWLSAQNAPYIIREAAILFESGTHRDCDETITVEAPEEERINRVVARSGGKQSREEALARIRNQWTDKQRASMATRVIVNNNTELILPRIMQLHSSFMA